MSPTLVVRREVLKPLSFAWISRLVGYAMEALETLPVDKLNMEALTKNLPTSARTPRNRSASSRSVSTIVSKPSSAVGLGLGALTSDAKAEDKESNKTDLSDLDDVTNVEDDNPPDFRYRHISDVMSALGGLWRRRLYTDLSLVVEGKVIRCHKVILSAASTYFHSRLFTGRRESPIDKIFITNISKPIMDEVLDFMYTGECPINQDNADDILKAACLFQIPALQDMADLYISENINGSNCLRLFKLANTTNSSLTKEQAKWVITNHFMSVWQTPMFRHLSCKELISIIDRDDLAVPDEDNVVNAILAWLEADKDKRRIMLSEILRHVHLPQLRKEYIKQALEGDRIVKQDVVCQRLMRRVKRSAQSSLEDSINKSLEIKAAAMKDDVIMFIGGIINEDAKFKCMQQVLAFNLQFRKFYSMASLPMGCDSGVACCKSGNDIFISGLGETRQCLARYVSSQNIWRILSPMGVGRRGHAMVTYGNYIFVLGGMVDNAVDGTKRITSMVERYDIKRNRWNFAANLPESVWGASAAITGHKIVSFGGYQSRETPTTSVQTYDMKTGLSRVTSQLPFPVALTQTVECDGVIYIVCPTGNILKTTDCWRFQNTSSIPNFKRAMFGATAHHGRLVVAGGKFNQEAFDDMMMVDLSNHTIAYMPEKLPLPMYGFGCIAMTLNRSHMVKMAFE